jgi:hypothetical protein
MNELTDKYAELVTEPLRIPSVWTSLQKEVIPHPSRERILDFTLSLHPFYPAGNQWLTVDWQGTFFIVSLWNGPHGPTDVAPVMFACNSSYWWPILQPSRTPFPTPQELNWIRDWSAIKCK